MKTLSDKRIISFTDIKGNTAHMTSPYFMHKDVAEAVKRLKEELREWKHIGSKASTLEYIKVKIDEIFGEFE